MADKCDAHGKYTGQHQKHIFENNVKWCAEKSEADPDFFKKLNSGQQPDYL